ncbi:MAG: hypothetical protein AB7K24_28290, partial [Gemmataceae bacterium]
EATTDTSPLTQDGQNIWPLLTGAEKKPAPRTFYWAQGALRKGDWKLVKNKKGVELYNLATDKEEKQDVADKNPKVVDELSAEFDAQKKKDADKPLPFNP